MNKKKRIKKVLKVAWNFFWNEDSLLSWIVFLGVIFLFIKFIFFPVLSLIFGTSLPIVIVESCSMYHDSKFNEWWDKSSGWYTEHAIKKEEFEKFPLKNGFSKGDIFIVNGIKKEEIEVGDTIIFTSGNAKSPIIHRVVSINPLSTKGDNNGEQFTSNNNVNKIDETFITEEQIIGKATMLTIPYLGWLKLIFFEPLRTRNDRGFCD